MVKVQFLLVLVLALLGCPTSTSLLVQVKQQQEEERRRTISSSSGSVLCTLCSDESLVANPETVVSFQELLNSDNDNDNDSNSNNDEAAFLLVSKIFPGGPHTCRSLQLQLQQTMLLDEISCNQLRQQVERYCQCNSTTTNRDAQQQPEPTTATSTTFHRGGATTASKQKTLTWLTRITGIISTLSSLYMIVALLKKQKQRQGTEAKLLLGMAFGTAIASLAWAVSTWPVPKNDDHKNNDTFYGAHGTTASCTAQAFFLQAGGITAVLYALVLTVCTFLQLFLDWNVELTTWFGVSLIWFLHGIPITIGIGIAAAAIPFYQGGTESSIFWICYLEAHSPAIAFTIVPVWATILAITAFITLLRLSRQPSIPLEPIKNKQEQHHQEQQKTKSQQDKNEQHHHKEPKYQTKNTLETSVPSDEDTDNMLAHVLGAAATMTTPYDYHYHHELLPPPPKRAMRRGSAVAAPSMNIPNQQPQQQQPPQFKPRMMRRGSAVATPMVVQMHAPHQPPPPQHYPQQQPPAPVRMMRRGSAVAVPAIMPTQHMLNPTTPETNAATAQQQQQQQDEKEQREKEQQNKELAEAAAAAEEHEQSRLRVHECAAYFAALALTWTWITISQLATKSLEQSYGWWVMVACLAPLHGFFNACIFATFQALRQQAASRYKIPVDNNDNNNNKETSATRTTPLRPPREPEQAPGIMMAGYGSTSPAKPNVMAPFDAMMGVSDRALFGKPSGTPAGAISADSSHDLEHPFLKQSAPGVFTVRQGHELRHIHATDDGEDGLSVSSVTESFCDDNLGGSMSKLKELDDHPDWVPPPPNDETPYTLNKTLNINDDDDDVPSSHKKTKKHQHHHHPSQQQHHNDSSSQASGTIQSKASGTVHSNDPIMVAPRKPPNTNQKREPPTTPMSHINQKRVSSAESSSIIKRKGDFATEYTMSQVEEEEGVEINPEDVEGQEGEDNNHNQDDHTYAEL